MGAVIPIPIPIPLTPNGITTDLIYEDVNDIFEDLFGTFFYGSWYKNPLFRLGLKFLLIITHPRTIKLLKLIGVIICIFCIYKILCGIRRIYKYILRKINQPRYERQMKLTREQQQKSYEEKTSHHAENHLKRN